MNDDIEVMIDNGDIVIAFGDAGYAVTADTARTLAMAILHAVKELERRDLS